MIIIVFLYLIHLLSGVVVLGKMASLKPLVSRQERKNSQPLDIKILGHNVITENNKLDRVSYHSIFYTNKQMMNE